MARWLVPGQKGFAYGEAKEIHADNDREAHRFGKLLFLSLS
jgi:hypothetical protein